MNFFYAGFEKHTKTEFLLEQDNCPRQIYRPDECKSFKKLNAHKVLESNNVLGQVLRECADEQAEVFTDVSLLYSAVPTCFKKTVGIKWDYHVSGKN